MSVLAVIPCLNEASHLPDLIEQMLNDETIDQLVVADGGSTDGSREIVLSMADGKRLVLLDNPDRIQSAGVNRAVATFGAHHRWLLRIDAHCLYPERYAEKLLASAQHNRASAVVVPMVTVGKGGMQLAIAAAQNSILGTGGSPHRHLVEGRFVEHGHHALMDLDLFRAVGGYCEAMPCNEDAEFDHRQQIAGGTIWLEPTAALTYFPRSDLRSLWKQYRRYGQGRARNLRRHGMRPRVRQLLPLSVPLALGLAFLTPIHPVFLIPAASWFLLCVIAGVAVGIRAGGGWAMAAGLAAATMQLGWALGFIAELVTNPAGAAPRYGLIRSL